MTKQSSKLSVSVQPMGNGQVLVPLGQAARIFSLLEQIPLEIRGAGDIRIEVSNGRMEIFGPDRALTNCKILDPSKVRNVTVRDGAMVFDVECEGFSQIVIHTEKFAAPGGSSSQASRLTSRGESRVSSPRVSG